MPPEHEEAACTLLWELGTAGTQSIPDRRGVALIAYFEDRPDLEAELRGAVATLGLEVTSAEIADVDWLARVREGFRAFSVGAFRIVPAWDARSANGDGGGHLLVVEPGIGFGTGTHESTRLGLAAMEERAAAGPFRDVLDVGAGSGILSVAAARLGARRVVAVELDEGALPVTRRHAVLNDAAIRILRGDGARALRPGAFDLVVANLTAPLLIERASELLGAARGGGHLVLSGLLGEDVPAVRSAYETAGTITVRADGEWSALVVHKRA